MTTSTANDKSFFTRAVAAVAILGPVLLVALAAALPDGERGELIVNGHIFLVGVLGVAIALRAAYDFGFERAHKLRSSTPRRTQTA